MYSGTNIVGFAHLADLPSYIAFLRKKAAHANHVALLLEDVVRARAGDYRKRGSRRKPKYHPYRERRLRLGMTQKKVAEAIGIHNRYMSCFECNRYFGSKCLVSSIEKKLDRFYKEQEAE